MKLSRRAQLLKPSPTMAMAQKARDLAAMGKPVVSLTLGEPDWACFPSAVKAAHEALEKGKTKYLPAPGLPELKTRLASHLKNELGVQYKPQQIVVGAGAKYVIYSLLAMLLDPNDEVVIPAPYWVSYPTMVELAGGVPRIIETSESDSFKLTAAQLDQHMQNHPKTRVIILCSPNNPTGFAFSKSETDALARVIKKYPELIVISDDIYNQLMLTEVEVAPHLLHSDPTLIDQVIPVNGASKIFSMTGLRVGWAAMPENLARAMGDFFSQTTSNAASVSQFSCLGAFENYHKDLNQVRTELKSRVSLFGEALGSESGLHFLEPQGAFYVWLNVKAKIGMTHRPTGRKIHGSQDLAQLLLEEAYLATVPGFEFGTEGFLRLSIASSREDLREAARRLNQISSEMHV